MSLQIDITIMDALKRAHQCATIQLDFQLPERFLLEYQPEKTADAPVRAHIACYMLIPHKTRPVIVHRAILGSVERMIAILTESYGGKWPFWLSPRQAKIIPVVPKYDDYAGKARRRCDIYCL